MAADHVFLECDNSMAVNETNAGDMASPKTIVG